jgi:hypothetical protein
MMDYSEAYIMAQQSLRRVYDNANDKDFDAALTAALDLLLAAKLILADIQAKNPR